MTIPTITFEYSFGEKPLFEDLKDIWFNVDNGSEYHDVKFIPLYKKLHLSLLACKQHMVMSVSALVCLTLIIFVFLFSDIGLHPVDVSIGALYKNFCGVTKISIEDFVKKNSTIFMDYVGEPLDNVFVITHCIPYAFANDGTAIIKIQYYDISCLINKKGSIIKFIDNE